MRKTREEAGQTREAILDAAEQVFYDRGVAGGALEEIARVAGVTRGAVYWHFDNKLALFLAIGERAVLPQEDAMRQIEDAPDGPPLELLERCIVDTFRSYGADHSIYRRLTVVMLRCDYVGEMAGAMAGHAALTVRLSTRMQRYFRDRMMPTRNAGSWQPEVLGRTLLVTAHGALLLWLRDPQTFPLDRVAADCLDTVLATVRTQWCPVARPLLEN